MAWRLAESLKGLRSQIDDRWPGRSKLADGSIGDTAHSSRTSDHNPDDDDVVCAIDVTNDPAHGLSSEKLAQALVASNDPRIKYIISNRKIYSGDAGPLPWKGRYYGGKNAHSQHVHISVRGKPYKDMEKPWRFHLSGAPPTTPAVPVKAEARVLRKGMKGDDVKELQQMLNKIGSNIPVDGDFGTRTQAAVKVFQRRSGLVIDGVVGVYTLEKLREAAK